MPYIQPEAIQEARRMDALTWLKENEPWNLIRLSINNYCTAEHDSLKLSNGKWYWFSRGFGGVCALDYLMKVKEYTLPEAVEAISGMGSVLPAQEPIVSRPERPKQLLMPELEKYPYRVKEYLMSRGIHKDVIDYCISHSLLFESSNYHNAIFVGYDRDGIARAASIRSTTTAYKGEVSGSNKKYSFNIPFSGSDHIHLFESAVDLLSYASLELMEGKDWKSGHLLSLAGVFIPKREAVVPVALQQYLDDHPEISTVHLHLDNDEVGLAAASGITKGLADRYAVYDEPAPAGCKDINDQLKKKVGITEKGKEVHEK